MTNARSSWVRRVQAADGGGEFFVKVYEFPRWRDRLRNFARWTAPWRAPRARREAQALTWLRTHGFGAPAAAACYEWRRAGFVCQAALITSAVPGRTAECLLGGPPRRAPGAPAPLPAASRQDLARDILAWVAKLHRSGFRDGNLDLRNLIITPAQPPAGRDADAAWTITKIDSPRYRIVPAGTATDSWARADWQRLLPQLRALGLAAAMSPSDRTPNGST
ncbi:MAG: lipopolysaccharide kinase InaA family protein [Planctomycetota bacterium]